MNRRIYFVTKNDYKNNLSNKGILEVPEGTTIADNSCSWNETYQAFRVNDASITIKGAVELALGYFKQGDKIKISAELLSVSGVLPKVAIDRGNIPHGSNLGNLALIQASKQGKFEYIELTATCIADGYCRLVVGTFTADIGDWYVRNLSVECDNRTNSENKVSDHIKTNRNLMLLSNTGSLTKVEGFSEDNCTLVVEADNSITVTLAEPFSYTPLSPITIFSTNQPYAYGVKSTAQSPNGFKMWIHNKDGVVKNPKDPSIVELYININALGYDYKNTI